MSNPPVGTPNRLAGAASPYLLQHAGNPVDWQPWDDQALDLARDSNRPILLSIGYSACHWCHVMAHESFEDERIAALMNRYFVCIKVDREERPDLDKVYQLAHQLLTQQPGGWPLTMFLDPDTLVPFFGGTYFPPKARHQLPGFGDLLTRIADVFANQRDQLRSQGDKVAEVLAELNPGRPSAPELADRALLDACAESLARQYDATDGGFGGAPKFPMPGTVDRLLRGWGRARARGDGSSADRQHLDMVMTTLTRMARGGIHDHLGGGFCRYATDRRWMIPHFEKMLYDNGQLLALYSDALGLGPDALFEEAASGIARWLIDEMRHPEGGFYTALDADSEGEEGRFYLWRRDDVRRLLTEDEYLVVETLYGLDKPANFEGRWILHRYDAWPSVIQRLSLDRPTADGLLRAARGKLFAAREQRPRPGLDDKILTSCNALAIKGLALAAGRLERPDWLAAARQAADFLRTRVFSQGVLHATWKGGEPRLPGYLDDYAFLLDALLALLAAGWRDVDAAFARTLAEALLTGFEDQADGGFYFTAHDHEALIHRPKPTMDDAMPPGNGIAARALHDLGHLFGEARYLEAADRTIVWARSLMERLPAGHCSLLTALEDSVEGIDLLVIRGPRAAIDPWLTKAQAAAYRPGRRVYAIPVPAAGDADGAEAPDFLPAAPDGQPRAYRCSGRSCSPPIETLAAFEAALER